MLSVSSTKWSGINEWNRPLRCFSAASVIGVFQYWFLWGLYGNSSMQMILLTWCECLYRLHRRVQMARIVPTVLCLPLTLPGNWLWHSDFTCLMFGDNRHCLLIYQISVPQTCCTADRVLQQRLCWLASSANPTALTAPVLVHHKVPLKMGLRWPDEN